MIRTLETLNACPNVRTESLEKHRSLVTQKKERKSRANQPQLFGPRPAGMRIVIHTLRCDGHEVPIICVARNPRAGFLRLRVQPRVG